MIDIHSHVLPGLDDGANSPERALEMVRMAAASGTTDMVATPHANAEFSFLPGHVERAIQELQQAAGETPRIHYGCELHFTLENIEDALRFPARYSVNHRGYLLVEFSDFLIPRTTGEILGQLCARGMRPILVHPERNRLLQKRPADLEEWVGRGCFIQVTSQSFSGRFGRSAQSAAESFLDRGIVHFVASDGHDLKHRPPVLAEGRRYLEERFGKERAEQLLVLNPRAVLSGAPILTDDTRVRRRNWFSFS